MSDKRYDILFAGELLPGFDAATVSANLGKLFKADAATLARLMDGASHVLKRDADQETARKYEAAMARSGARAVLRENVVETPRVAAAAPEPQPATTAPGPQPATAAAISVAPAGGELLAEHERRSVAPRDIDVRHIKLVSAFAEPADERAPPPPAPDTSHISVAEAGADLLPDHAREPPPPAPDTSAITLAEAGERLLPESEPVAVDVPDVSAITLAPPGADLEQLRPHKVLLDPDTSGLEIEPPA